MVDFFQNGVITTLHDLGDRPTDDLAAEPLLPVDGALPVGRPTVDPAAFDRLAAAPERVAHWEARLAEVRALRQDRRS